MKRFVTILFTLLLLIGCGGPNTSDPKFSSISPLEEIYLAQDGTHHSYYFKLLNYENKLPVRYDTTKFRLFSLNKENENSSVILYGLIFKSDNDYYPALWADVTLGDLNGIFSLNLAAEIISGYPIIKNAGIFNLEQEKELMLEFLNLYAKENKIKLKWKD